MFQGLVPESQGQNLALTVLHVPNTLDGGPYTRHPTPDTLPPYSLHPTPYTLHPTPSILHPTPYSLHPSGTSERKAEVAPDGRVGGGRAHHNKKGNLKMFQGLLSESQGQFLALIILHVPNSLNSGE